MINTKLTNIDISESEIDTISVDDVIIPKDDFLTREQHEMIIERLKDSLRAMKYPERWIDWEDCKISLKEKYNI